MKKTYICPNAIAVRPETQNIMEMSLKNEGTSTYQSKKYNMHDIAWGEDEDMEEE